MYLNCKTFFSWRYGTFKTEDLVLHAVERGVSSLALTNINCTSDIWDFLEACREQAVKAIAGAEIRNNSAHSAPGSDRFLYVLLAKNNNGLLEINRFLSGHLQAKEPFVPRAPQLPDTTVIYPLDTCYPDDLTENEYIGVLPQQINKLFRAPLAVWGHKYVILQPVTFKDKTGYNLHRLLRAIDKNTLLSKLDTDDSASPTEWMPPPARLMEAFRQYPFIITNTLQLMEACSYSMEFGQDKNKKQFSATAEDDRILLKKLAKDGLEYRYGLRNKIAAQRVEKELKIINDLGFNAYFLIAWDVIRYAQSRGFYYVGRGSGANSIVAYCLQITDVDPIELDLYFERFLNPHRSSPPDFDIDFSWKDRDEVIDYIFKRYGAGHVALLGMYDTFQYRAVVRELGKVFGLPKAEIDALVDHPNKLLGSKKPEDKIQRLIVKYGQLLQNFPNHLSIHPGGMLISEKPIHSYGIVEMPPKGFGTIQLDMFVAEKIGLFKLDILSQRGLGHIKETLRLVRQNREKDIDIHRIEAFKKDPKVAAQIRKADTIGCFYIESPAMRQLLKKLRCDDYLTLVAASSIIRPGVSQSGMMKEYIFRFHHPDKIEYLHPKMEELLKETYGVMVYQEDVIKVAHHFADIDMADADILRRAMSGKYRGKKEIMRIRDTFFENCKIKGYPWEITAEVWRQIESFSGYSFSKAHSASFAVESYQSLYLKTYYPQEFMVAVINNFGGFYDTELYFHELKRAGARLHAPCVNRSHELTHIAGSEVYVGLIHVDGLEQNVKQVLLENRAAYGPFADLHECMERTGITPEQTNLLIRVGAFRFTGKTKKELLWQANFLHRHGHVKTLMLKEGKQEEEGREVIIQKLFEQPIPDFHLPQLDHHPLDDAMDEMELLGFTLSDPFTLAEMAQKHLPATDSCPKIFAGEMEHHKGKTVIMFGYLVTWKPVHTIKRELMCFGTFLDEAGNWLDTVHFPDSLRAFPLQGKGFYSMQGKVVEEFGVFNLEVHKMSKIGLKGRR